MKGLARRRYQADRAKSRARRFLKLVYLDDRAFDPKIVGRYATDRKPCSCEMCGNPRHFGGGPTRQELSVKVGP